MNLRTFGLLLWAFGFVGSLAALYMSNDRLLIIECALMISGAAFSTHGKPRKSTEMVVSNVSVDPETLARAIERAKTCSK